MDNYVETLLRERGLAYVCDGCGAVIYPDDYTFGFIPYGGAQHICIDGHGTIGLQIVDPQAWRQYSHPTTTDMHPAVQFYAIGHHTIEEF